MKTYLLDTSPLTAHLFGRRRAVEAITPWIEAHEVATSIVVYGEIAEYLKSFPDFPGAYMISGHNCKRYVLMP